MHIIIIINIIYNRDVIILQYTRMAESETLECRQIRIFTKCFNTISILGEETEKRDIVNYILLSLCYHNNYIFLIM